MKRIISLFCVVAMLFTLCSCNKPSYPTASTTSLTTSLTDNGASKNDSSEITSSENNSSENTSSKNTPSKNNSSKNSFLENLFFGNTSSKNNSSNNTSSKHNSSTNFTSSNHTSSKTSSSPANDDNDKIEVCKHSYSTPTCEKASVCSLCGAIGNPALGHKFIGPICSVSSCSANNPKWTGWHSNGEITISKSEIEEIVSMQYKKPKNVIYMIGDGMGENDLIITEKCKENDFDFGLVLNQIPYTGYATTYCANSKVTDSAAAATALATGYKTNSTYVGISPTGQALTNISEIARQKGKLVGIITNDKLTGATPAAFIAHTSSRDNFSDISEAYVNFKPDILIGREDSNFSPSNLSDFICANTFSDFASVLNSDPLCQKPFIGYYKENILSQKTNTLARTAEIALNRMKHNKNGFFLMIENTVTDNAGHDNNIQAKMNGVVTFDRTVATVLKFMKENPDTLLIITSDHETGGVKLPQNGAPIDDKLFTTRSHTGVNVRTFAVGYGAEYFNGKTVDNTDIAKFAIAALDN